MAGLAAQAESDEATRPIANNKPYEFLILSPVGRGIDLLRITAALFRGRERMRRSLSFVSSICKGQAWWEAPRYCLDTRRSGAAALLAGGPPARCCTDRLGTIARSEAACTPAEVVAAAPMDVPLNKRILAGLGLIVLISVALGVCVLTRDHAWGDDFAAYILQAQSILHGDMHALVQHSTFTIERSAFNIGPVTQLWGFPLLLAPAVAAFGLNILSLKFLMTLCHAAFVCVFFLLARTRLDPAKALLVTALVAFNPLWLQAQNDILSDLPFALFSTLALWLIVRGRAQEDSSPRKIGAGLLEGVAIFMAAFTRWTGLLLFIPLLVTQVWPLRRQSRAGVRWSRLLLPAAVPYATFAVLYVLQAWLFPSVAYPLREQFADFTRATPWQNAAYYFRLAADFFDNVFAGGRVIQVALLLLYVLSFVDTRQPRPVRSFVSAGDAGGAAGLPGARRAALPVSDLAAVRVVRLRRADVADGLAARGASHRGAARRLRGLGHPAADFAGGECTGGFGKSRSGQGAAARGVGRLLADQHGDVRLRPLAHGSGQRDGLLQAAGHAADDRARLDPGAALQPPGPRRLPDTGPQDRARLADLAARRACLQSRAVRGPGLRERRFPRL